MRTTQFGQVSGWLAGWIVGMETQGHLRWDLAMIKTCTDMN